MKCTVIRSLERFDEVLLAWQALAGNPTVDPDFCRLLAATRPEIVQPYIVAVQDGPETVAILAGRVEIVNLGFRIGYKTLYRLKARCLALPYGGIMGANREDVCRCLVDHVLQALHQGEFDMADFDNVRTDSLLHEVARKSGAWRCRNHFVYSHMHWRMALPATGEAIEKGMSKKHRYWVRRMRKRLQERFPNKIQFACLGELGENWALAEEIELIARHTYQRGLGVGFLNNEEHRRRLELWSKRGLLRAYILRVEGKPIAFCLGTRFQDTFFLSHTAFIPEMGEFEPGTLVFLYMLDCLCGESVKSLDFGLGDAFYKQRFGTESWQETMLCLFAPSFKGLLLNLTDSGSRVIHHTGRSLLARIDSLKRLKKKWRQKLAESSTSEVAENAGSKT